LLLDFAVLYREVQWHTAGAAAQHRMGASTDRSHHSPLRVLAHIKKLDDCFGPFLVRVTCRYGTPRRSGGFASLANGLMA